MGKERQGFASLTPDQRTAVSRKGGEAARDKGVSYKFAKGSQAAKVASAAGLIVRRRNRKPA